MTYQEIVNRIQGIVDAHYQLADFGYGDLSDLKTKFENSSGDSAVQADYPYLFLNPGIHNRTLSTITYNFNMIVMDMARGEVSDQPYNNSLAIQSQCQQMIDDVLANLYYGFTDKPEVVRTNISYTPFNERFSDDVSGMTASLSIEVPQGLNDCIAPIVEYGLQVEATNTLDRTMGPDDGDDRAFAYDNVIWDPANDWELNKYTSLVPGQYKFVIDQEITLNQPAVGDVLPNQPVLNQLVQGIPSTAIAASTASGWPTVFVNTTTVYRYQATYFATVPEVGPTYVWEFLTLNDQVGQEESTFQQLPGGPIKIYKTL